MTTQAGNRASETPPEQFTRLFCELLSRASTPALPPYLSYRDRWILTCDILLGHPPVRGAGRPRDYPMGPTRQLSLELTALLRPRHGVVTVLAPTRARSVTVASVHVPYRLHDFVAAARTLWLTIPEPPQPAALTLGLLYHVLRCLICAPRRDAPYSQAKRRALCVRLMRVLAQSLGFNKNERSQAGLNEAWSFGFGTKSELPVGGPLDVIAGGAVEAFFRLTEWMAILSVLAEFAPPGHLATALDAAYALGDRETSDEGRARQVAENLAAAICLAGEDCVLKTQSDDELVFRDGALAGAQKSMQQYLFALAQLHLVQLEIKGRGVQDFLAMGRTWSTTRGLSAWASQTTARLREQLIEVLGPNNAALLTDSDAIVLFAARADPRTSTDPSDRDHPPVGDYQATKLRTTAVTVAAGLETWDREQLLNALPVLTALPSVVLDALIPTKRLWPHLLIRAQSHTLLDFCVRSASWNADDSAKRAERRRKDAATLRFDYGEEPSDLADALCWGLRRADAPIANADNPPWLGAGVQGAMTYCPRAQLFSLAGKSWRQITAGGLRERMEAALHQPVAVYSHRSDRNRALAELGWLATGEGRTGANARAEVLVRIDGAGVGALFVETPPLTRGGLSQALERTLVDLWFSAVLGMMRELVAEHGTEGELVLPVDLFYVGGDDLQFLIPAQLFPKLLEQLRLGTREVDATCDEVRWKLVATGVLRARNGAGIGVHMPNDAEGAAHRRLTVLMAGMKELEVEKLPVWTDSWLVADEEADDAVGYTRIGERWLLGVTSDAWVSPVGSGAPV